MEELLAGRFTMEYAGAQFRLSTDSMVLADFAAFPRGAAIADLGCGCGALSLLLCAGDAQARLTGVELQPDAAACARRNAGRNGLTERFTVINGDLREHRTLLPHGAFDGVISNPPYYPAGSGRAAENEALALARSELACTLDDLCQLHESILSIAAVPSGVTRYRKGLYPLTPYDRETAAQTLNILEEYGRRCVKEYGTRLIYPGDEWYLAAERPVPESDFYEEYAQLENGVGMWRLYRDEFLGALAHSRTGRRIRRMDVVTGTLAAPLIQEMMEALHGRHPSVKVTVHPIRNNFFGGNVGVAGLVTATDIIAQCEGRLSSGTLGVPAVMLREEKDTFLDDMTIEQLGQRLGVKVEVLPTSGGDEAKALLRSGLHIARRRRP